ncbi:hypothetical protein HMPREF9080_00790 [Cardiobacterium valvarum F0432]|uniref:HTH asnC-type domain-containing protein n=1 Tax=Cardiobacterium valvarum F0432 TaxID=797473 RepID=G9ZDF6_9GAMM|nr:Lrp/AsnC family transcriptional regulator [Cardiobacterium valvarum]EHM55282.1 hypothetical protein HMPREF9080_00790 [Cardiobacterium valvarum F0432]
MKLDAFDKKILQYLQEDNRIAQRDLAEKVNRPPPPSTAASPRWKKKG